MSSGGFADVFQVKTDPDMYSVLFENERPDNVSLDRYPSSIICNQSGFGCIGTFQGGISADFSGLSDIPRVFHAFSHEAQLNPEKSSLHTGNQNQGDGKAR